MTTINMTLLCDVDGLISPLQPSTATIQGRFINVELTPDLVTMFNPTGNIISASSNDGSVVNKNYVAPPVEEKKSKRGRKKKEKVKTARCKEGRFGSMIQFIIRSLYIKGKVYKIKAFNKETFQVPGVLDPHFGDVMPALNELAAFLEKSLGSDKVTVEHIRPLMRNYTCRLINPNYRIDLTAFANFIINYQNSETSKYEILDKLRNRKAFRHNNLIQRVESYLPANRMGISLIQFNLEKYAGIKIKFRRPLHNIMSAKDLIKDITIKVYQSGKINVDGGKVIPEIEELYLWFNYLLKQNFDELIVDITNVKLNPADTYRLESVQEIENVMHVIRINQDSGNFLEHDDIEAEVGEEEEDDCGYGYNDGNF